MNCIKVGFFLLWMALSAWAGWGFLFGRTGWRETEKSSTAMMLPPAAPIFDFSQLFDIPVENPTMEWGAMLKGPLFKWTVAETTPDGKVVRTDYEKLLTPDAHAGVLFTHNSIDGHHIFKMGWAE